MHVIGLDFDNTIVCYDHVFYEVALERKLVPKQIQQSKQAVRNYLRSCDEEDTWIELQGLVYGPEMRQAKAFPGILEFFSTCHSRSIQTRIVSHRTKTPFKGPAYDLHEAARSWIQQNGFFEKSSLSTEQIFFELTSEDKARRIASENCSIFVDDLPEFLNKPEFPKRTRRILFDPNHRHTETENCERVGSWQELSKLITDLPIQ